MIVPSCVIFDIDGTLSNCDHRLHWIRSNPRNWKAFNAGIPLDSPNWDIIWMLRVFRNTGAAILIASGRNEDDRDATIKWLNEVAGINGLYDRLYMRGSRDFRPDDIVKSEILDQMRADGYNPTVAVDDRDQVVTMWRQRGLRCLQVAEGNF